MFFYFVSNAAAAQSDPCKETIYRSLVRIKAGSLAWLKYTGQRLSSSLVTLICATKVCSCCNKLFLSTLIHVFIHLPSETTIFLQRHLGRALWRANQPGGLHHRVEYRRRHLQRWRHGGLLQRGSHGKPVWQVRCTSRKHLWIFIYFSFFSLFVWF